VKNRSFHIVPLLFTLFSLLPFAALVLLQGAQWYLKYTAGERMQHHQVITVSLPVAHVVWHKKDKELSIDGKLFDVESSHLSNGTLTVTGFYDDEEISLISLLSKLTSPEKNSTLLHFLLVLQCFAAPLLFYFISGMGVNKIIHLTPYSFFLPQSFSSPAEQPPQC
jgi:hypothetical protein